MSPKERRAGFKALCFAAHQLDNETAYDLAMLYHNDTKNKQKSEAQFKLLNENHLASRKIIQDLDDISLIFSLPKGSWENDFFVNCYTCVQLAEEKAKNK